MSVPLSRSSIGTGALLGSKRLQLAKEARLGPLGRPRLPCPLIRRQIERILLERSHFDPELLAHCRARPAHHMIGLVGGREPIGSLEQGVRVLVVCGRDQLAPDAPSYDDIYNQLNEERVNSRANRYLRDLRRDAVIEYR